MQAALVPVWAQVADEELVRHSRAVRFEQGRLTVQVDGPVWAHRLRIEQANLLVRLRDALGEPVREMVVRIVPGETVIMRPRVKVIRELSSNSRALIDSVASGVNDEALRKALRRLAGHSD